MNPKRTLQMFQVATLVGRDWTYDAESEAWYHGAEGGGFSTEMAWAISEQVVMRAAEEARDWESRPAPPAPPSFAVLVRDGALALVGRAALAYARWRRPA